MRFLIWLADGGLHSVCITVLCSVALIVTLTNQYLPLVH